MYVGIGGLIFIIALLVLGFFMGFAAGILYVFRKIRLTFSFEEYRNIVSTLHADVEE